MHFLSNLEQRGAREKKIFFCRFKILKKNDQTANFQAFMHTGQVTQTSTYLPWDRRLSAYPSRSSTKMGVGKNNSRIAWKGNPRPGGEGFSGPDHNVWTQARPRSERIGKDQGVALVKIP